MLICVLVMIGVGYRNVAVNVYEHKPFLSLHACLLSELSKARQEDMDSVRDSTARFFQDSDRKEFTCGAFIIRRIAFEAKH